MIRAAAEAAPRRGSASKVAASKASSLPTGARGRLVSPVPVLEPVPVRVLVRVRRAVALGVVRRCEGKDLGVRVVVEWLWSGRVVVCFGVFCSRSRVSDLSVEILE